MSEYTPSTTDVRNVYLDAYGDTAGFDRWLLAERARIWDEGYWVGVERNGYHGPDLNPYRKGGDA